MLPIGIKDDNVVKPALQPVTQTRLNRFPFAEVLFVHDHLRSRGARVRGGRVARSIIDHENMRDLLQRSRDHVADVLFLAIARDNCCDRLAIYRARRSRTFHRQRTTGWKSAA